MSISSNAKIAASCKHLTTPGPGQGGNYGDMDPSFQGSKPNNPADYKDGPSPFTDYDYKDPTEVSKNIEFNKQNRVNKSYDKHADACFNMKENRNKKNLEV